MLVLSRRIGESIVLPTPEGDVVVTVLRVERDKIRLGITAPKAVTILREELLPPRPRELPSPHVQAAREGLGDG